MSGQGVGCRPCPRLAGWHPFEAGTRPWQSSVDQCDERVPLARGTGPPLSASNDRPVQWLPTPWALPRTAHHSDCAAAQTCWACGHYRMMQNGDGRWGTWAASPWLQSLPGRGPAGGSGSILRHQEAGGYARCRNFEAHCDGPVGSSRWPSRADVAVGCSQTYLPYRSGTLSRRSRRLTVRDCPA